MAQPQHLELARSNRLMDRVHHPAKAVLNDLIELYSGLHARPEPAAEINDRVLDFLLLLLSWPNAVAAHRMAPHPVQENLNAIDQHVTVFRNLAIFVGEIARI